MVRLLIDLGADPNEVLEGYRPVDYWLREDPANESLLNPSDAGVLRELIAGGAEVCGLVELHRYELRDYPPIYTVLWNSAPECWPER